MIRIARGFVLAVLALAGPAAAQQSEGAPPVFHPMDQFTVTGGVEGEVGPVLLAAVTDAYSHALAALALWAVLMIVLSILSVVGKPLAKTESGHPVRNYSDPAYRRDRAFQNAIETSGPFLAATLAAILVGGPPFWVNLLASVFVVARIAMAVVHVATEIQPLRSAFWFVGQICILGLASIALVAAVL